MARSVKQKYEFDARDGILSLDRLMQKFQAFGKASDSTRKTIDTLAHSAQALTGVFSAINFGVDRFSNVANAVIKANSEIEQLKTSLTGLISVSHSNVSSMGKMLNVQQKWVLSTKKAEETLQSLNKIASKTSFSLDQTSQMFKAFYSTASGSLSLKQSIEAFEGLANMASVVGINVEQMIRTLDGVGAGKWTSSELTRFLEGNLGLTKELAQEAIKSGKYYELLMDKLKEFNEISKFSANTYEASVARLKNEFNELAKVVGAPMFEGLKDSLNTTSKLLEENREAIAKVANFSIEAGKHLGVLAGAFVAVKASTLAYSAAMGGAKLISEGFGLITKANITSLSALNVALKGTSATFKTFLPTALVFGGFEILLRFFDDSKKGADALTESIKKTNEELSKMTANQRLREISRINSRLTELRQQERELTTKLNRGSFFSPSPPKGEERATILAALDDIKLERIKLDEEIRRIEKINEDALNSSKEAADKFGDLIANLNDKYKNTTILADLKKELADVNADLENLNKEKAKNTQEELQQEETRQRLLKAREEITKKINNFNKEYVKGLDEIKSALKEINEVYFTEIEKNTQTVIDKYNKMIDLGISKKEAQKFLDANLSKISQEHLKRAEENEKEIINKQLDLRSEYYKTIGEYEEAWQIEKAKLEEKYQKLIFENGEKLTTEQFKKLLEIEKKKFLAPFVKNANSAFKDIKGSWADTVSSMQKTVEDGFFNFFIGKTKSLKTALKDIGANLMRDMISPYARTLSQGISGGFGALLGGGSNLASIASNLGLAKNDSGGWSGLVGGTTVELSSTGQILRGADALDKSTTNLLGSISNLQSAYSMLTSGYTGMVGSMTLAPAGSLASWLSSVGWAKTGGFVAGFGSGANSALTGTQMLGSSGLTGTGTVGAGYVMGAGAAGGALGYGVGTLGDRLFKANSYASSVGAVGGALGGMASAGAFGAKIGSMVGPWGAVIGAVAGALIGGMFGKKKAIGSGISVEQDFTSGTNLNSEYIRSYVQMQKKGWFSKKEWKDYHDLGADILGDISSQVKQMEKLALRAGAITSLTIKKGAYSGNSFSDVAITKAIISAMTGLDQEIWAEQISTTKKRKGFLGKLTNVYDKIMKYSPSTLANKATRPLDNALGRIMNKNGLGALHDQSIAGRVEIGDISDGKILDFEPTKKLEEKLGIIQEIQTKNMRQIVNPEIERMFQDWQEIAKKEKKNINEVITASLVSITDTYKSLALISQKNPLKQAQINIELMFEEFKDAAEGLKVEIPKNLSSIAELSVEEMASAYRKAIANDFTKENIDGLNSLVKVYQEARKAQEDYTKAVISFTQQIANTQSGFYQSNGIDTSILALNTSYKKFAAIIDGLSYDISDNQRKEVAKFGSATDISSWSKYLLSISYDQMQSFLSSGNTELRKALVEAVTEHKQAIDANGGKEGWIKPLVDLEAINKQIAALKLAEQAEKTLQIQKEQLSVLSVQKSVIEKLGSIAQRIRDNVIDRQTSSINYQFALERARVAWNSRDYNSKAFENLSNAANHQQQYFKDTAKTYEEYKLNMLAMVGEIEAIADNTTLNDINKGIKRLEEQLKISNKTGEAQLTALEIQRMQLIENSQNQIKALDNLLGTDSPMIRYLRDVLEKLIINAGGGKKPEIPNYTGGIENINSGIITKNGAMLLTTLDKDINNAYLSVLGRSVEQGGLDAWKDNINSGRMTLAELPSELRKTAIAITGSTRKEDWIAWYKSKGYVAMADGGIVTRPTRALIGEAGYSEAVIPLDGRTLKVDADNRELEKLLREVVYLLKTQGKDMKELNMTLRNVTDGDVIFTRSAV